MSVDSDEATGRNTYPRGSRVGIGIAIGLPVGAALGLSMDNLALWAGIGLIVGIVVGSILEARGNGGDKK